MKKDKEPKLEFSEINYTSCAQYGREHAFSVHTPDSVCITSLKTKNRER